MFKPSATRSFFFTVCLAAAISATAQQPPANPANPANPAAPPAPAQTPATQAPLPGESNEPLETITVRANLVNLVFTVTDKNGRFIRNLQKKDFGLLDDGRPPAAVIAFTQQTNLPLRIGIMLDTSSSIRTRFKFEQDAAKDFFYQVVKPGMHDSAFVEGFDVQLALTQDYTSNLDLLNTGIEKLRPGGGTALFDSLYKTCQTQMLALKEAGDVRKVIILVSDGDDNYSRALESDAIKMCQRADTIVYAISTDTSPTKGKGGDVLQTIASATGGKAYFPIRLEDVSNSFKEIEEELRSQYSLEYRPADLKLDGSFRTILLRAMTGKYVVRAKTGYFSPKASQ
jgi:VWFA-related protein